MNKDAAVTNVSQVPAPRQRKAALILKGGGVKGIALASAYAILESYYEFDLYAGASAGAIAAALIAAGCPASELVRRLGDKDFRDFLDTPWPLRLPRLLYRGALHSGDHFQTWVREWLAEMRGVDGVVTMSDLPRKVIIYAADPRGRVLFDKSGLASVPVDHALRCSMSIPFLFDSKVGPNGVRCVDGGVLNNFPVNAVKEDVPAVKDDFIAIFLGKPIVAHKQRPMLLELLAMWLGQGELAILKDHEERTIVVRTDPIRMTQFGLTADEKELLRLEGEASAKAFLLRNNVPNAPSWEDVDQSKTRARDMREKVQEARRRRSAGRLRWASVALTVLLFLPVFGHSCGDKTCTTDVHKTRDSGEDLHGENVYGCNTPSGCHHVYAVRIDSPGPIESVELLKPPPPFVHRCPDANICGTQATFLSNRNGASCEDQNTCYAWFAERNRSIPAVYDFRVTYTGGWLFGYGLRNTLLYGLWQRMRGVIASATTFGQ